VGNLRQYTEQEVTAAKWDASFTVTNLPPPPSPPAQEDLPVAAERPAPLLLNFTLTPRLFNTSGAQVARSQAVFRVSGLGDLKKAWAAVVIAHDAPQPAPASNSSGLHKELATQQQRRAYSGWVTWKPSPSSIPGSDVGPSGVPIALLPAPDERVLTLNVTLLPYVTRPGNW
jgi:hypothetical protein